MQTKFNNRAEYVDYLTNLLGSGYDVQAIATETGAWSSEYVIRDGRRFAASFDVVASDEDVAKSIKRHSPNANELNFFVATRASFAACEKPEGEPDYVSGSGSAYWYTAEGVVRMSDHWGAGVASCDWYLDGKAYGYGMSNSARELENVCGYCDWAGFKRI